MIAAIGDFCGEYLVSTHDFTGDWSTWEIHPKGDEVVCLLFITAGEGTQNREI